MNEQLIKDRDSLECHIADLIYDFDEKYNESGKTVIEVSVDNIYEEYSGLKKLISCNVSIKVSI